MMTDTVIQGDALEVLKTLPDNSVNCCVTSPPYYGLRDYGTGEWIGGDASCDHSSAIYSKPNLRPRKQTSNVGTLIERTLKVCPVCGARRVDKQIGLEDTPEEFVARLVDVFHEVKRVLKDDGTLWVNIGDSYSNKNLVGIPWELAFALRNDGWYLRQDIIWHKPNPMPESVKDRFTKSHEYIFMLSKKPKYYFDHEAVQEESKWYGQDKRAGQGRIAYEGKRTTGEDNKAQQSFEAITDKRNKRDVWSVNTKPVREAHFATYPEELIEPCILAGCPIGGGGS